MCAPVGLGHAQDFAFDEPIIFERVGGFAAGVSICESFSSASEETRQEASSLNLLEREKHGSLVLQSS